VTRRGCNSNCNHRMDTHLYSRPAGRQRTKTTTDRQRSQAKDQTELARTTTRNGRITLHPTLFRSRIRNKPLTSGNIAKAFESVPGASMDTHLLRLLSKHIPTQLLLNEVAGHPHVPERSGSRKSCTLSPHRHNIVTAYGMRTPYT
jgi:hypothetical protein